MTTHPKCLRCQVPMTKGFQVDHSYLATTRTYWIEGEPESPRFWSLTVGTHDTGNKDAARYPITLFRCSQCGCLESYALPAEPSKK